MESPCFCRSYLLLFFPLLIPLFPAQYSNNPSTDWPLSDFYNTSDGKSDHKFSNFIECNNDSTTNLDLLNDEEGLYGRCTDIRSSHALISMPYTVYFRLCFVMRLIAADGTCMESNGSYSYALSVVALNQFGKSQDPAKGQVVWTANVGNPVTMNACLHLEEDSNLKLVEYGNGSSSPHVVWETNTTDQAINASLAFTFEGNLVLFSNTTEPEFTPLWQSYQQPSDTLMVLQVLEENSSLTYHSVLNSPTTSSVDYRMMIDNGRLAMYVRFGQHSPEGLHGSPYWLFSDHSSMDLQASPANDHYQRSFAALCWDSTNQLQLIYAGSNRSDGESIGEIPPQNCSSIHGDQVMKIEDINVKLLSTNVTYATFLRLETDGDLHAYTVNDTRYPNSSAVWKSFYSAFQDMPCQLPLQCGFYGKCVVQKKGSQCTCDAKFEFSDASNARLGCKLKNGNLPTSGSLCDSISSTPTFVSLENVRYFSINFTDPQYSKSHTECQNLCGDDCNCTAAFWDPRGSCFLIRGKVGTIQNGNMTAYIRSLSEETTSSQQLKEMGPVLGAVAVAIGVLATIVIGCIYLCKRRRNLKMRSAELENKRLLESLMGGSNYCPERFSWKQMHEYTCGFSDALGAGGFGSVFRGSLPDGTAVAVKQLDEVRSHGQGDKEFIAEVSILSRIHHAHLVRLIGFCLEGAHRLLVYEFMDNGSLDSWLFKSPEKGIGRKEVLSWKTRFQIAVGTAKGLAYLHEECEDRVIHMDFKPQNILLGRDFSPKISDFGMSRRIDREQSSVMTLMRGTPGYLAPEWLLDCSVTEKCDVFSFGIVLLELVSGRKVKDVTDLKQRLGMRSMRESVMVELLDDRLKYYDGSCDVEVEEAVRMVEVALMCVRKDPEKRPPMSMVTLMLGGTVEVKPSAAMDYGDGDGELEEEQGLVMYPSSRNRTMRSGYSSSNNSWTTMSIDVPHSSSSHYSRSSKKKQQQQEQTEEGFHMGNNSRKPSKTMESHTSYESDSPPMSRILYCTM